jgi:DNA invertase Pin-like site-specific DNA recombinase/ElaB/YqjD/DUF883 family membrane-anchored ribosome-binding protein
MAVLEPEKLLVERQQAGRMYRRETADCRRMAESPDGIRAGKTRHLASARTKMEIAAHPSLSTDPRERKMISTNRSVAGYVRVSSDKQDTARQRASVKANALNLEIDQWFEDAEGHNARDMAPKRKEFQRMLGMVEAGQISTIIVDSQDRFGTKDAHELGFYVTILRKNGCSLYDANGKLLSGDDEASFFTTSIAAMASAREQREKARRCTGGLVEHAKMGCYVGGYPPYGTDVVCLWPDGQEKWRSLYVGHFDRLKVYPSGTRERFNGKDNSPQKDKTDVFFLRPSIETERLRVVKQIFDWYATEAISPGMIATRLNELKIDPVFGKHWNKVKIHQLLKNPVYAGRPVWNKRGGGRFVEFVGGQIREIPREKGIKGGRQRAAEDFVGLEEPQFEPIVDQAIWDAVQSKLASASAKQKTIQKRPAQTAELWLKPFLICGQCLKPMRATRGGNRVLPSYYCGTYGTYGAENDSGCHCHRLQHELVEDLVKLRLGELSGQIKELLATVRTCPPGSIGPTFQKLADAQDRRSDAIREMWDFVESYPQPDHWTQIEFVEGTGALDDTCPGTPRDITPAEVARFSADYSDVSDRVRPEIERAITDLESDLDKMVDDFRDLAPEVRERANAKMKKLQAQIDELKRQAADLRQPLQTAENYLTDLLNASERANDILANGAAGRQKTEVMSRVIDKIICHFGHSSTKGLKNHGKSRLIGVEVLPATGGFFCFTDGISPERG